VTRSLEWATGVSTAVPLQQAIRTNSEQVAKSFHYLLGELLFWFGGSNAVYCATEPRHS
jgi:hypothetical protein